MLVFQPGATAEVVGKDTSSNYWIIQTPTGGTCWLWGAYATVQGNVAALAEMHHPLRRRSRSLPPLFPLPVQVLQLKSKSYSHDKAYRLKAEFLLIRSHPIVFAPAAPSSLTVSTTCTYNVFHILRVRSDHLSWPAVSNAQGYYAYENGSKISSTTGTSINLIGATTTGSVSFGVVAYNSNGTSGTTSASSHCQ